MHITYQKLHDLPVETESGTFLGHVLDLNIDIDNFQIKQFEVQDKKWLGTEQKHLIGSHQIVSITSKKIIVQNSIVAETEMQIAKSQLSTKAATSLNAEMDQ